MKIKECLFGCINRATCKISYGDDKYVIAKREYPWIGDNFNVENSDGEIIGSIVDQYNNNYISGDKTLPLLRIFTDSLYLYIYQYDEGFEYPELLKDPVKKIKVCDLQDITKMDFSTGGGWKGECYPERKYKKTYVCPECGEKIKTKHLDFCPSYCNCGEHIKLQYAENEWVCILHRSTGAITIHREFPF